MFALLLGLSLVLFPILFFSLLYGQIVSLNRAVQTTGRIIDISWQYKWSACGETGICYEGFLTVSRAYQKQTTTLSHPRQLTHEKNRVVIDVVVMKAIADTT